MDGNAIAEVVAERFRIERPPTLLARRSSKARIGFTRMRSGHAMRARSLTVPPEEAFSFHVPLSLPFFTDLWVAGRRREVPDFRLGDVQLVDLRENPRVSLDTPFDSLRFYIPQSALDEMANEEGIRQLKGLHAPNFCSRDLVMYGLAQALAAAMELPGDGTAMFSDYIALAFFAHVVRAYGSVSAHGRNVRGGLAPWQMQRARDFINATWRAILQSPRSRMRVDCQPVTSFVRLSKRRAYHPTNG